ncbi:hypothetical protein DEU56DRAFT_919729 [Suillus clintonianus]|uniref:uncharacterized protein n=1 Tax=Suillus clintonianus TaxID=1904413 RepID=UPI001B87ECA1|nr:uncharacterized protein DEU56DRAFT_919729 [Suillus clintonianus]KAG2113229.1 hypothetical protein DEU56DRAFT_919729 [Suillus clintonianus]
MPAVEIISLPVLGKMLGVNEQPEMVDFCIRQDTTVKVLREKLKEYGLQSTGKKVDLIERLREYATDDSSWRLLFQPAQKGTRGSYTGKRMAKLSAQRITSQFGEHELTLVQHKSKRGGISRMVHSLTPADINSNDAWATEVLQNVEAWQSKPTTTRQVTALPTPSPPTESPCSTQPNLRNPQISLPDEAELTAEDGRSLSLRFRRLERTVAGLEDTLIERAYDLEIGISKRVTRNSVPQHPLWPLQPTDQPAAPRLSSIVPTVTHPAVSALSMQAVTNPVHVPAQTIPPRNLAVVQLEDGELAFDKTAVMRPPAVRFSTDVSALFREWHCLTYLVVNGRGIPVKYWGEVYKKCAGENSKAWALRKVQWGQWKFIVEERSRFASDDAFWAAWSDASGQRAGYTQICDTLQRQRVQQDAQDAAAARTFFGGSLDHSDAKGAFAYLKSGVARLMSKDVDVARKWRDLLSADSALAQRWEETRSPR